jgi:carboxyl-terminal processing protease
MTKLAKKVSLLGLVLSVSWLGVSVGQGLTHQIFNITSAQAATFGNVASSKDSTAKDSGSSTKDANDRYENLELFQKVLHFVETNYVDDNIKTKDLVYGALKGMMETLDPHSNFLPPDVWKDMKIDTSGKFGGLGIEIGMKDSILTIIAPIEDTPAWKAGLKPNDRIVKIDGESTKGMNLVEAVNKMRGKKGTDVSLSVYREGWDKIRDISVTRDIIKIQSVKSEMLEPGFGYVRLTSFNESAAADMKKAIDGLQKKGKLKGLVFDMRMNPGGLLDQAVDVSSLFIDEGVVVSTIPRNKDQKEVKYAKKGMAYKDFPVVVLVNSSTASAAEIVSGALQDHHRAVIMGQTTFGKGSVQTVVELGNDVGLKLTIARYYTPSGRSIQDRGVQPDILLDDYDPKLLSEAKRKGEVFREVDLKGHMANPDGVEDNNTAENLTNTKKAGDYKKEELESLTKKKDKNSKGDKKDDTSNSLDDEMSPMKFNAKEDYQVREAVNYLKGFEVFKKIATPDAPNSTPVGKKSASAQ